MIPVSSAQTCPAVQTAFRDDRAADSEVMWWVLVLSCKHWHSLSDSHAATCCVCRLRWAAQTSEWDQRYLGQEIIPSSCCQQQHRVQALRTLSRLCTARLCGSTPNSLLVVFFRIHGDCHDSSGRQYPCSCVCHIISSHIAVMYSWQLS